MIPTDQPTIPKVLKLTPMEVADLKDALDEITVYEYGDWLGCQAIVIYPMIDQIINVCHHSETRTTPAFQFFATDDDGKIMVNSTRI